jgi:hypothetical protein
MKPVKLNWALAPWMRSHNDHVGHMALLSFDCYVDKDLFEAIKPEWAGYVMKNGKKTALYNYTVLEILEEKGYPITLDGVSIKGCRDKNNLTDYLLEQSQSSTCDWISYLANVYLQKKKWQEQTQGVLTELKNMWQPFERAVNDTQILGMDKTHFSWTRIHAGSDVSEHDYQIDVNYGVRKGITYDEPSHEYFVPVDLYSRLKPDVTVEHLKEVVSVATQLPIKPKFDHNDKWMLGYDSHTFEPKKGDWRFKNKYW